jgi:hypothetical protein
LLISSPGHLCCGFHRSADFGAISFEAAFIVPPFVGYAALNHGADFPDPLIYQFQSRKSHQLATGFQTLCAAQGSGNLEPFLAFAI